MGKVNKRGIGVKRNELKPSGRSVEESNGEWEVTIGIYTGRSSIWTKRNSSNALQMLIQRLFYDLFDLQLSDVADSSNSFALLDLWVSLNTVKCNIHPPCLSSVSNSMLIKFRHTLNGQTPEHNICMCFASFCNLHIFEGFPLDFGLWLWGFAHSATRAFVRSGIDVRWEVLPIHPKGVQCWHQGSVQDTTHQTWWIMPLWSTFFCTGELSCWNLAPVKGKL